MQTTETLKRQINTAEDLSAVVRTMKTLAAVNIRQYEAAADAMQVYDETIRRSAQMLAWNEPSLVRRNREVPDLRTGLVAFGSDQGMCGGFNEAIAGYVDGMTAAKTESERFPIVVLGRRLMARLADRGHAVEAGADLSGTASGITFAMQHLLPQIDRWRTEHRLQAVIVCHNHRLSQTRYEPTHRRLLPASLAELAGPRPARWPGHSLPLITMPTESLWQHLARQYLFVSLFHACAESQASENAARIAAMQAAETHIRDRLVLLNHSFQQLRQTSITEELLDVITGFEALSTDSPGQKQTVHS